MNFNKIFTTFFWIGTIKKAPGTFGSLAGLLFWLMINKLLNINDSSDLYQANWFWLAFVLIITIYALDAIKKYGLQVKEIDHKSIVIDEVVGVIIALQIVNKHHKIISMALCMYYYYHYHNNNNNNNNNKFNR